MRQHLAWPHFHPPQGSRGGAVSTPAVPLATCAVPKPAPRDERWQVLKDKLAVAAVLLLVLATITVFVLFLVQQAPGFGSGEITGFATPAPGPGSSERRRIKRGSVELCGGKRAGPHPAHPDLDRSRDGHLRGTRLVSAPRHEAETLMMLDSAPCLRVFVLGSAFVEWQGQRMTIARRQARGLLYRLAAQFEPVPREELCFTFWPDEPEGDAHRHLSHLLSQLKQSLPLPAVVRAKNELVDVDRQMVWSDSAVFWSSCAGDSGDLKLCEACPGVVPRPLHVRLLTTGVSRV